MDSTIIAADRRTYWRRWSAEDDALLRDLYDTKLPVAEIAAILGRTKTSIYLRCSRRSFHSPSRRRGRPRKLNDEAVRDIRRQYAAGGITQGELGRRFGVSIPTISHIVTRRRWAWLDA